MQAIKKWFWNGAGGLALLLALLGVLLPIMPTVPFLLLAAYCFSRGSRRVFRWLLRNETLRHSLRDWQRRRAIARPAKILATVAMSFSLLGSLLLGQAWLSGLLLLGVAAVLIFIWRCPDA